MSVNDKSHLVSILVNGYPWLPVELARLLVSKLTLTDVNLLMFQMTRARDKDVQLFCCRLLKYPGDDWPHYVGKIAAGEMGGAAI